MSLPKDNALLLHLESCRRASKMLNQARDRDRIPQLFLEIITHTAGLGYDRALLFLTDRHSNTLRLRAAKGPVNRPEAPTSATTENPANSRLTDSPIDPSDSNAWIEHLGGFVLPTGLGVTDFIESDVQVPLQVVIGKCAFNRQPYYSNDVKAVFEPPPAFAKEIIRFEHLAVLPLVSEEELLGVLMVDNLYNRRQIDQVDMIGLDVMANLLVTAIENTHLNKKLQESTQLDGVTGTFNRQHFEACLDLEVDRAKKAVKPLSLLAFHLHDYPRLYENIGWHRTAKLMKKLAEVLIKGVRSEDMIVRFGRADFLVLLTGGATVDNTMTVGKKLIQELSHQTIESPAFGAIHVSAALGSLPASQLSRQRVSSIADEVTEHARRQPPGGLSFLEPIQ